MIRLESYVRDQWVAGAGKPAKKPGRIAQLRTVLEQSRQLDPKIGWWMLLAFVGTWAVIIGTGITRAIGPPR